MGLGRTSGTIDVSLTNGQLSSSVAALVDNQRPFLGNNGTKVQFDVVRAGVADGLLGALGTSQRVW